MKKTRTIHNLYSQWQKIPKEIRNYKYFARGCIVGKWQYHYKNENGEIGLVRFNYNLDFNCKKKYCYEACGTLDFERFSTLTDAESVIYKKLGEHYKKTLHAHKPTKKLTVQRHAIPR